MSPANIVIPTDPVEAFCRKWNIIELALFGSVLRDDFGDESDLDVLVTFAGGARRTLFDLVQMQEELEDMVGRKVDLVERRAIEESENYIRRRYILESAEPVYVA